MVQRVGELCYAPGIFDSGGVVAGQTSHVPLATTPEHWVHFSMEFV